MKKIIYSIKFITALTLLLVVSLSCDNEFSNIESNIQGIKNFSTTGEFFPMVAKTKLFTPLTASGVNDVVGIQTNNSPGTLLGVYKDPNSVFGTTEVSLTTQITPTSYSPSFGEEVVIESAILNIPYFSTLESTDDEGVNTYTLDSVFGNQEATYKLSIYRNNYVLRDLDPDANFEASQSYYSNQQDLFDGGATTQDDLIYEDSAFKPSVIETSIAGETADDDITRIAPSLRIDFKKLGDTNIKNEEFWEKLLLENATSDDLSNQSLFTNYFRGLIFKVEKNASTGDGSMFFLNVSAGTVAIDYTNKEEKESETATTSVFNLNFNGISVNTFNTVDNSNDVDGAEDNLYLKGGDGAFAVIDLFAGDDLDGNGLSDVEDEFRSKKDQWLINEANLVFYVNQELVQGDEPERVTLYDLKNNIPVIDYFLDGSADGSNPDTSRTQFSEALERDDDDKGVRYKFRITNHINNILKQDSTNVKLGLYVTYNIDNITESKIQGINSDDDDSTIDALPASTVLSPKGTILYGSDESLYINPVGKAAEFEIFYTDSEN